MEDNQVTLTFKISEDEAARLDELARRTYRSRSDMLRYAVGAVIREGADVAIAAESFTTAKEGGQ